MKNKWLVGLLAVTTAFASIAFVACDKSGDDGDGAGSGEETGSVGLEYELSDDGTYYSLKGIGECTQTDIVVPNNYEGKPVQKIAAHAFNNGGITSIVIGDNVEMIGSDAFHDCFGLTSVVIGKSVSDIGERVFMRCTSLTNIDVSDNNQSFKDIDGNLYTKSGSYLLQYALGKPDKEFVTPGGVEGIAMEAFADSEYLETAKIVCDMLGNKAFVNSKALKYVELDCESVGGSAFQNCEDLEMVKFDYSVRHVGDSAFYNCVNLKSIVISDLVTFGSYPFYGAQITKVFYTGTSNNWVENYLTSATKYIYSGTEMTDGNYWHYVDGVATAW